MSREIKFDAIYKPTGEHFTPHEINFNDNTVVGNFDGVTGDWCHFSLDGKRGDAILRQYTGLKDKNGVEIYEGDIVKVKYTYEQSYLGGYGHDELIGQIEYRHGCFDVYKDNVDQVIVIREHISDLETEWEVIGNIYQNPELLERGE